MLVLAGIAETAIARQWRWLALIAALSLIPAVIIIAPEIALIPDVLGAFGLSYGGKAIALLFTPALVTFAYAITRSLRPAIPRGAQAESLQRPSVPVDAPA